MLRWQEKMTVICVAHRLSNLAKADRLLVLQEGAPEELQRSGGVFASYAQAHQSFLSAAA